MYELTDRVAIVTGAAGNLGGAVARTFGAAGAKLVLVDRGADRLPQLFSDLVDSPRTHLATSVNLADPSAVDTMVKATLERFGKIDVLVNAVGGWRGGTAVHETPLETWDLLMNLNVRTMIVVSSAVIPVMLKQGSGKIINVAARAGLSGSSKGGAYSATKSAVIRLTESMSAELKSSGINVNCVLPATIDTPQNRADMPKGDASRWVKPEAIADVILFLASDAAQAVQGAAIPVYGRG
jgi:NAD(P)-dependent dehydrogenase (short-subunit alcohol dehydrogenase family)